MEDNLVELSLLMNIVCVLNSTHLSSLYINSVGLCYDIEILVVVENLLTEFFPIVGTYLDFTLGMIDFFSV